MSLAACRSLGKSGCSVLSKADPCRRCFKQLFHTPETVCFSDVGQVINSIASQCNEDSESVLIRILLPTCRKYPEQILSLLSAFKNSDATATPPSRPTSSKPIVWGELQNCDAHPTSRNVVDGNIDYNAEASLVGSEEGSAANDNSDDAQPQETQELVNDDAAVEEPDSADARSDIQFFYGQESEDLSEPSQLQGSPDEQSSEGDSTEENSEVRLAPLTMDNASMSSDSNQLSNEVPLITVCTRDGGRSSSSSSSSLESSVCDDNDELEATPFSRAMKLVKEGNEIVLRNSNLSGIDSIAPPVSVFGEVKSRGVTDTSDSEMETNSDDTCEDSPEAAREGISYQVYASCPASTPSLFPNHGARRQSFDDGSSSLSAPRVNVRDRVAEVIIPTRITPRTAQQLRVMTKIDILLSKAAANSWFGHLKHIHGNRFMLATEQSINARVAINLVKTAFETAASTTTF